MWFFFGQAICYEIIVRLLCHPANGNGKGTIVDIIMIILLELAFSKLFGLDTVIWSQILVKVFVMVERLKAVCCNFFKE